MSFLFGTIHWEFVDFRPDTYSRLRGVITVKRTTTPDIFKRLIGRKAKVKYEYFSGGCNDWHTIPEHKKLKNNFRERMLHAFWKQWLIEKAS